MRYFIIFIFILFYYNTIFAEIIIVNDCKLYVQKMRKSSEHRVGMLGYTDNSFEKDGMLFLMGGNYRKVFHTMGMKMDIVIVGVIEKKKDEYETVTKLIHAYPGKQQIDIDAPHVLEIPLKKYNKKFKKCMEIKSVKGSIK